MNREATSRLAEALGLPQGIKLRDENRRRREYGGLKIDQAKRLKELERENDRLKRAVSELTLDKLILKEALSGKY